MCVCGAHSLADNSLSNLTQLLNHYLTEMSKIALQHGATIDKYGYCTVGNFGSEERMDYTMVGGTVNLASRLEHEAPPSGVLVSFETYAQVKDAVCCEERGRVQVKGIAEPVLT